MADYGMGHDDASARSARAIAKDRTHLSFDEDEKDFDDRPGGTVTSILGYQEERTEELLKLLTELEEKLSIIWAPRDEDANKSPSSPQDPRTPQLIIRMDSQSRRIGEACHRVGDLIRRVQL